MGNKIKHFQLTIGDGSDDTGWCFIIQLQESLDKFLVVQVQPVIIQILETFFVLSILAADSARLCIVVKTNLLQLANVHFQGAKFNVEKLKYFT